MEACLIDLTRAEIAKHILSGHDLRDCVIGKCDSLDPLSIKAIEFLSAMLERYPGDYAIIVGDDE